MTRATILLALLAVLSFAARSFLPPGSEAAGSGAALAFGFLLLAAIQAGHVLKPLGMPQLTGFILCGAVFGPEILGLITPPMVHDLTVVKRVAVGLIALTAGCELNLRSLLPRMRSIVSVGAGALLMAFTLVFLLLLVLSFWLPFTRGFDAGQRVVVSLVCATVLTALSPAVVMGIISETRSKGPLTELALSIVVLADLVIVVTFSLTESAVRWSFPGEGGPGGWGALAAHVGGSIAAGVAVGTIVWLYVWRVGVKIGLFIFGVCFVVAEAGGALHLDPLLVGLSAGLFLENVSPVSGHEVIRHTEPAAMPTFAVFFAVVGAEVHLRLFLAVAGWAVLLAVVRATGLLVGCRVGARLSRLDPDLARRIHTGMLPQAGISLGLANLIAEQFPPWGEGAATLLLGTILVSQLVGPIVFRSALARAGEIGKRDAPEASEARITEPESTADVELRRG
ncbi:MAG: sodium:proton exchanger [Deltaproteobacteria bacterium]|nr:sodium:proton exchanger [Deltaproteobacteria bacterium]